MGLVLADLLLRTSYRLKGTMQLAVLCTLFVWLWGALMVASLTVATGTLLQRVTCSFSLRTFGKYSYALYFVHGHANRLSAKLGFDPNHGIITGGTVLPCQILYIFVAPGASLVVRLPKVAFIRETFPSTKVLFPTRKRLLARRGHRSKLHRRSQQRHYSSPATSTRIRSEM